MKIAGEGAPSFIPIKTETQRDRASHVSIAKKKSDLKIWARLAPIGIRNEPFTSAGHEMARTQAVTEVKSIHLRHGSSTDTVPRSTP